MTLRWYDWLFLPFWVLTVVLNFRWGGMAAVVVFLLIYFASYRLGKALGR